MLPKEILEKIRLIDIKSTQLAEEIFSGEYHSFFKGNGMEFQDIRQYYPGDDVRNIDWKVTARQNKSYVKQFKEERELNLFLLVDLSASTFYGSKRERISEIAATLAFSAVKNGDKVGALIFTNQVEKFIPSKKGKKHVLSIVAGILDHKVKNKKTDLKEAIKQFQILEKKRSIVFILSDFLDDDFEKELSILDRKHDVILIRLIEASEKRLPKGVILALKDLETGEEMKVDTFLKSQELNWPLKNRKLIEIQTDKDFVKPLMLFFKKRVK